MLRFFFKNPAQFLITFDDKAKTESRKFRARFSPTLKHFISLKESVLFFMEEFYEWMVLFLLCASGENRKFHRFFFAKSAFA